MKRSSKTLQKFSTVESKCDTIEKMNLYLFFFLIKMISIKRLNTNKFSWLQNSEFYKNIDNFEEPIYLEYCSKYTKDIKKYLRVINLWGISYFPKEFLDLFYKTKPLKEISELFNLTQDLSYNFLMLSLITQDISYWGVRDIKRENPNLTINIYDCGWKININDVFGLHNIKILEFLHKIDCKPLSEKLNSELEFRKDKRFCKKTGRLLQYNTDHIYKKSGFIRENVTVKRVNIISRRVICGK